MVAMLMVGSLVYHSLGLVLVLKCLPHQWELVLVTQDILG